MKEIPLSEKKSEPEESREGKPLPTVKVTLIYSSVLIDDRETSGLLSDMCASSYCFT